MLNPAPANVAIDATMLVRADILTPNETEFAALLGRHVGERIEADAVASLDQARLHALCRDLLAHGSVIVTLGASGCFVSHADAEPRGDTAPCYRISAEPAQAIDTTGAGDAFNGALAASLAQRPGRLRRARALRQPATPHAPPKAGAAAAMGRVGPGNRLQEAGVEESDFGNRLRRKWWVGWESNPGPAG